MSMRELVYGLTARDPDLNLLIPEDRWYSAGAVEDTPSRPFAVMRYGVRTRGMGDVLRIPLTFWVHQERGSFDTVDAVIQRIKVVLGQSSGTVQGSTVLVSADWSGDGEDLQDPAYRTNVRTSGWTLIGKEY